MSNDEWLMMIVGLGIGLLISAIGMAIMQDHYRDMLIDYGAAEYRVDGPHDNSAKFGYIQKVSHNDQNN